MKTKGLLRTAVLTTVTFSALGFGGHGAAAASPWTFQNNPFGPQGVSGSEVCTVEIGSFTGPSTLPSAYHATVNWGDTAYTSPGSIVQGTKGQLLVVAGCHRYLNAGSSYYISATVYKGATRGGSVYTVANISGISLQSTFRYTATAGQPLCTFVLGSFTDTDGNNAAAAYSATVNFHDGSAGSRAIVVSQNPGPGLLAVYGCHTFAAAGTYNATVAVRDTDGASARSTLTFVVS